MLTRPVKEPKSRDDLAKGYYKMFKVQRQNQEKLASGEMDEDDLWAMAFDLADRKIQDRIRALRGSADDRQARLEEISKFRAGQEKRYRSLFEWNSANDETTLKNILDNECNTFEVNRSLQDPTLPFDLRDKLYDRHTRLISAHKELLAAAGIDRLTRDKKQVSAQPIDDWFKVKRAAFEKMQELKAEFGEAAAKCETEADLRDAIKYHFGFDFEGVVDVILRQHRRVLALPMEIADEDQGIKSRLVKKNERGTIN